jgi:hypothetical protein
MEAPPAKHSAPALSAVPRREFIRLLGLSGTVAVSSALCPSATAGGMEGTDSIGPNSVPVRSPAFRSRPGARKGHVVLFCQRPKGEYLAYDLNSPGSLIWRHCLQGEQLAAGDKRNIGAIAKRIGMTPSQVAAFVADMQRAGLVYMAGSGARIYFERQGPQ